MKEGLLLKRNCVTETSDSVNNKKLKYSEDVEEWEDDCVLQQKVEEEKDVLLYHSERQLTSLEDLCENNSLHLRKNSTSIRTSRRRTDELIVKDQDEPNSK